MAARAEFQLLSPSFLHDGQIPRKFTCRGLDISPALAWNHAPANTKSFALTMEDPGAPGGPFVHWLVYNLPAGTAGIPEGFPKKSQLPSGTLQGKNGFGKIGYSGPCPPVVEAHKYVFKIHALNMKLKCKPEASGTDLANAMRGHVLATAELVGRYQITEKQMEALAPGTKEAKSRLEALRKDPDYLIRTHNLQKELKKAHSLSPSTVEEFFRTTAFSRIPARIQDFLKETHPDVRRTLEDYVTYANRYRVYLRLQTDTLEFEQRVWPQYGVKFYGKVVEDHLEPADLPFTPSDDDSLVEYFRADDLVPPPAIKALIDAGKATFFRIDEKEGYSILRQVEDIAHKDDGVTIIEHNAEQPYFIAICGPKMNKELLPDLGPALTEFQRERYHESFGGRPRDVKRLRRDLEAEKKPTSQKEKAIDEVGTDEKKLNAEKVRRSRLKSKIVRTKP